MRHLLVTAEELQQHVADTEIDICGDFGQGYHSAIKYRVGDDRYRVYDHREVVLTTPSAEEAAAAFNSLRPRAPFTVSHIVSGGSAVSGSTP